LFSLGVRNALIAAIRRRDIQEAKHLLATEFPLNSTSKTGKTPLHQAAAIGDAEFLEFLLAKRADINAITSDGLRPIHCAAAVDIIPICLAILRAGFDLDAIPDTDQPYQRCRDAECRKFLFDYWKRDHYLQMSVSFFESRKDLLFDCLNTAGGAKDTTNTPIPTFDSLAEFVQQLIFATDMILPRVRRNKTPGIRPEFSCHHLLQLMDSMHIEAYAFALEDGFEVLCKIWATQDKELIFIFLMPIYWVLSFYRILEGLWQYLVPMIDDVAAYESLFRTCKARNAVVSRKMERLREILHSAMKESFVLPPNRLNFGDFYLYCQGKIDTIRSSPSIGLSAQYFFRMKELFGIDFSLPPMISITNMSVVTVSLFSECLCLYLLETEEFAVLPMSLINI
jgi:hypothetical protein